MSMGGRSADARRCGASFRSSRHEPDLRAVIAPSRGHGDDGELQLELSAMADRRRRGEKDGADGSTQAAEVVGWTVAGGWFVSRKESFRGSSSCMHVAALTRPVAESLKQSSLASRANTKQEGQVEQ